MEKEKPILEWQIAVPIFKNTLILKQLGLAVGIPFGALAIYLLIVAQKDSGAYYGLAAIGLTLLLTYLLVQIFYRGRYQVHFRLDDKGVFYQTEAQQAKKDRFINRSALVLGLLARKPAVTGAALMSDSRQQVHLRWNNIRRARFKPRQHTILIRGGLTEQVALFCTPENYVQVAALVRERVPEERRRE